jgi:hypothetical protein
MLWYLVSRSARKYNGDRGVETLVTSAALVYASTAQGAEKRAMTDAIGQYPPQDGFAYHHVVVDEIDPAVVDAIAADYGYEKCPDEVA